MYWNINDIQMTKCLKFNYMEENGKLISFIHFMKSWNFYFSCCHPIHNLELFLTSSKKPRGFYSNCPNPLLPLFDEKCPGAFKGFHPHEVQLQIPHPAPEHLLKANYFMASNKQLQLLILSHSVGATFHPSHLWFPEHYPKIPLAVQWSFSAVSVPSDRGSLAVCSSCKLCCDRGAQLKGTIVHSRGSLCERSAEAEPVLPGRKWRWSGNLGDSVRLAWINKAVQTRTD